MSTPATTATPTTKLPKMPLVLGHRRIFWTLFGGLIVFNFVLIISALTYGWTEGYSGEPGFSWDRLVAVIAGMFGSLGNFLTVIGALALMGLVWWGSYKLAKANYNKLAGALVLIALLLGVVAASLGWVNFGAITFGFVPFLVFVIGTGIEAGIFIALLAIPLRRKRTNH